MSIYKPPVPVKGRPADFGQYVLLVMQIK